MATTAYVVPENVKKQKFHHIVGNLGIALEATFLANANPEILDENLEFPEMIYESPEKLVIRVYYPAVYRSIRIGQQAEIVFVPAVDETEVQFHRLCFRLKGQPRGREGWVRFARFGEAKTFAFTRERPVINLDFFGKRNNNFLPLYLKVCDSARGYLYLKLEAEVRDSQPIIKLTRVSETEVPSQLAAEQFRSQ